MSKKNTLRNYESILDNFYSHFGDIELSSITSEDILAFMSRVTDGTKQEEIGGRDLNSELQLEWTRKLGKEKF
jgi:hypothetical protein